MNPIVKASTACLPLMFLSSACGDSDPVGPEPIYEGVFEVAQTNGSVTCAPEPLPAPSVEGSQAYVVFPEPGWDGALFKIRVDQDGSRLTVYILDENEQPEPSLAFEGSVRADGTTRVTRSLDIGLEDPREGGHRFFVQERAEVTGRNLTSDGSRTASEGKFDVIFRSGSENAAVFTTCTVPFTATGTRVSS